MDRLDAIAAFVAVADEASFVAAARRLRRSPAAVTRAVSALESRLGTRLLNRTTRAVSLTDAGLRQLEGCRRVLAEVEAIESSAASEGAGPQGLLTVTAPVVFGRLHLLPVLLRFLDEHPKVSARLLLLDRVVSLVEEGIDVGLRIGRMPDSSLRAVRVGGLRRLVCASPGYLTANGTPSSPQELPSHSCITFEGTADHWRFGEVNVAVRPRLSVSTAEAAVDAAVAGLGLVRVLSYQGEAALAEGRLTTVLEDFEPALVPIQLVHPAGRHPSPKLRLFIDAAAAGLRARFDPTAASAARRSDPAGSPGATS
jgi:DNA-binding transcriptional LysR family regulator